MIMKLSRILREADWKVTVTLGPDEKGLQLINIEPGDNTRPGTIRFVIDVGTTTIFARS